jgi:hypothetical protein
VPGLPDFSWHNTPKRENIYQIVMKYTKCPQNAPNGHKIYVPFGSKIYKMAIKIPTAFI